MRTMRYGACTQLPRTSCRGPWPSLGFFLPRSPELLLELARAKEAAAEYNPFRGIIAIEPLWAVIG